MNYLKVLVDLWKLKRNEKISKEQMQKLQDESLRKLLSYAWKHSAYYRRTFEAAGITEQQLDKLPISSFPTINKNILPEVRENRGILSMMKKPGAVCSWELSGEHSGICPCLRSCHS